MGFSCEAQRLTDKAFTTQTSPTSQPALHPIIGDASLLPHQFAGGSAQKTGIRRQGASAVTIESNRDRDIDTKRR